MKPKKDEQQELIDQAESEIKANIPVQNKLELMKEIAQVQSRIRKDITSDFTLAKLGEKDTEAIIEMTNNAYLAKKLVDTLKNNAREWTYKNGVWENKSLNETKKQMLQEVANRIFDSYMIRMYMTAVLNRNKPENPLLKILGGFKEDETEMDAENEETQKQNLMDWAKEKLKKTEE